MTATAFMDTHWQRAPLYASAAEVVANDDAGAEPSYAKTYSPQTSLFGLRRGQVQLAERQSWLCGSYCKEGSRE